MNNMLVKIIKGLVLLFILLSAGCNDPVEYKHFQKKELEDIGIKLPASAKCLYFEDCSGQRVTLYKAWVLCADAPFDIDKKFDTCYQAYGTDSYDLNARIINRLVGESVIHLDDIKECWDKTTDREDGVQIQITRVNCRSNFFLYIQFIKL